MNGKMFVLPRDKMKKLKILHDQISKFSLFCHQGGVIVRTLKFSVQHLARLSADFKEKKKMNERLSRFSCVTNELRKRPLLFMHTCPSYQSSFSSKPRCASKKPSIGHKIKCEVIILVKNSKKTTKTTTPTTTTAMSNTGQHERKPTSQRCECK